MIYKIAELYSYLFARTFLYKWNKLLFHCALRGLGVLNVKDSLRGEDRFIRNFLKKRTAPVIFDVGANVGDYSREVLKLNPQAKVYAFEPHPRTFQRLKSSIDHPNFQAFNVGCGRENAKLTLYDYSDNPTSSHATLYKDIIKDFYNAAPNAWDVDIVRLDEFIEQQQVDHIDLLKIDTEGHEMSVLEGLKNTLAKKRIEAIHFEFNSMNITSRTFYKDFYDLLTDYDFYRMLPDGLVGMGKYNPIYHELFAFQNFVAIRK